MEPIRRRVLAVVVLLGLGLAPSAEAQSFTVIGLPDTQNYSELYPQIFLQQTTWVADNLNTLGIRYVAHYGDVVQNGDATLEWENADQAMAVLDSVGVPYGVTAGNHDITPSGMSGSPYIPEFFRSYFGAQRFAGKPWYRGDSPSGMSSYQVFQAGGIEFLGLHIECDGALRELDWAQGVLNQHRDKPVVMTTHRYLQDAEDYTFGVPLVASGYYPPIWYTIEGVYAPDGIETPQIFDWFVRRNPNIVLVNCGHFHEEFRQISTNVRGRPVYEVLADYQDDPNGGDGWLRIMRFDLGAKRIDFDSFSPFLNAFRTADESKFSLPFDPANYRSTKPNVLLQEGIGSFFGTKDTWINEDAPNTSYGESGVRVSDDDTTNSFFSDQRGQALVRFDGLIGAAGAGRLPAGAQVVSAHLTLQLANDIDNPLFNPKFFVHRVLVPWQETSTWNSLGNGLQVGSELTAALGSFAGDNSPNEDGLRRIDVTAAVQAWANGAPNWGFAILPEIISGNDDGIEILTSESPNVLLRPALEVIYEFDCGYSAYGSAPSSAQTLSLGGIGVPRIGQPLQFETTGVAGTTLFSAWSLGQSSVPLLGGVLLLDPAQLGPIAAHPAFAGAANVSLDVPQLPSLAGVAVHFQHLAPDAGAPEGLAFSNGLTARICP